VKRKNPLSLVLGNVFKVSKYKLKMQLSQLICDNDLKLLKTCFFWCGPCRDRSALWLTVKAAPHKFSYLLDSHENNSNCRHHMSDFNAKMHQIRF